MAFSACLLVTGASVNFVQVPHVCLRGAIYIYVFD